MVRSSPRRSKVSEMRSPASWVRITRPTSSLVRISSPSASMITSPRCETGGLGGRPGGDLEDERPGIPFHLVGVEQRREHGRVVDRQGLDAEEGGVLVDLTPAGPDAP